MDYYRQKWRIKPTAASLENYRDEPVRQNDKHDRPSSQNSEKASHVLQGKQQMPGPSDVEIACGL